MKNYRKTKVPMAQREPEERKKDFEEVPIGYTTEDAIEEANRCLQCVEPGCIEGCPVEIEIPDFIQCIKENNPEKAAKIIKDKNSLPAICGRVCPQENQCELTCIDCALCWTYCPDGCIIATEEGFFQPDYEFCKGCGICVEVCPTGAIKIEIE